ncbi:MAG: hypothetical protein LC708_00325, partial [Actinobacteria bacterium]|nr:hypothetical protein [Actinomycetota bacterium]
VTPTTVTPSTVTPTTVTPTTVTPSTVTPTTVTPTTATPTTTSTTTRPPGGCGAALQRARAQLNAQIDRAQARVRQVFSGPQAEALVARLEQARARGNAAVDAVIASCPSGV